VNIEVSGEWIQRSVDPKWRWVESVWVGEIRPDDPDRETTELRRRSLYPCECKFEHQSESTRALAHSADMLVCRLELYHACARYFLAKTDSLLLGLSFDTEYVRIFPAAARIAGDAWNVASLTKCRKQVHGECVLALRSCAGRSSLTAHSSKFTDSIIVPH
jgi:hypothetical protein